MSTVTKQEVIGREIARIAGDALYYLIINDGRVADAFFIPIAPLRGFERIARGKSPEFVVEAVKRICGFCHASHAIAAIEAFEGALDIYPPKDAYLLREVVGLLNRVQSHILHAVLISRDVLREELVDPITRILFDLLETVNTLLTRLGGAPTHPTNLVIGGVRYIPSSNVLTNASETLKQLGRRFEDEVLNVFMDEGNWNDKAIRLAEVPPHDEVLATHPTYGNRYAVDLSKLRLIEYWRFRRVPDVVGDGLSKAVKRATAMVALYDGNVVEVGPRARAARFGKVVGRGLMSIQLTRLAEVVEAIERINNLIGEIVPGSRPRVGGLVFRRGSGVGVYEAPRGTLIHEVSLADSGRVESYRIVVPTQFNIPLMESKAIGLEASVADAVPRVYDPCIPCATHYVRVRE